VAGDDGISALGDDSGKARMLKKWNLRVDHWRVLLSIFARFLRARV